ncbi:universal stress protein [Actinomadura sp. DC4]|uniref:universal stress protein n=1 Tax=Actinomadura sp. DC4 TaxID=3055069 RepID=UPI0025B0EE9C|nr:universal stress protein [Actinomadura sp. DC4]MDN3359779.1 universal stress protein [Actinomadura sp. DC4]
MDSAEILVGYDGSDESGFALRWAVREARLRKSPLTACHVWHWPFPMEPGGPEILDTFQSMSEHTAESGAIIARGIAPGLTVLGRAVRGPAAATLLGLSGKAALLVVGHRGNEGFDGLLLGSVAARLAAHAYCPLVVVRETPVTEEGPLVAGVDGSPASGAVLSFAFEEAALRGVGVHLVCSAQESGVEPGDAREMGEQAKEAAARFERAVAPWCEKYPYVPARTFFVTTPPRRALLSAAEEATLLVVGRRGHGDVRGLLGSVSQYMTHYAPCPVAIVS